MQGSSLQDFRLDIESGFRREEGDFPIVSVNPQFPINRHATGLDSPSGSQNILFNELAGGGEKTLRLMAIAREVNECIEAIPGIRRLLEYYEHENETAFWSFLESQSSQPKPSEMKPGTIHGVLHHIWMNWTSNFLVGLPDTVAVAEAMGEVADWHRQSLANAAYCSALETSVTTGTSQVLTRRIISATRSLMSAAPAWSVGYLRNRVADEARLGPLDLLQDEFDRLRDVYQNVFEACCSSLWLIVLMRNTVENGSPDDFTGISYTKPNDPKTYTINTLSQFNKLANSFKISIVAGFPKVGASMAYLNSRTRNAIGHASAHHDLRTGDIRNDEGDMKPYFDFVGEVFSLFGPLVVAVQCSRSVAVAGRDDSLPKVVAGAP